MNSKFKYALAGAFALSISMPFAANADPFIFDPTGGSALGAPGSNAIHGVETIDQTVGSALAIGGTTAINNFINGDGPIGFTLAYQANLGILQDGDGETLYAPTSSSPRFTFVAGFGEKVLSADPYPGTATFVFDPDNPVNFFNMYATPTNGNTLTGEGFISGAPILEARITSVIGSNFQITTTDENGNPIGTDSDGNPLPATGLLDRAGTDNWAGQQTAFGAGSSDLRLEIISVNNAYFPDLDPTSELIISLLNNSQITPFGQVNPSQCFNMPGNLCGGIGGGITSVGTLGNINGAYNGDGGENFIFQADANQSITRASEVPEPASLALIGLGLSLIGFFNRRRYAA